MAAKKQMSSEEILSERNLGVDEKMKIDLKDVAVPQSERCVGSDDDEYEVTAKTWVVVLVGDMRLGDADEAKTIQVLALSSAISFLVVPSVAYVQGTITTQLGSPEDTTWFISVVAITIVTYFMISGANLNLFGRRYFIIAGSVIIFIRSWASPRPMLLCPITPVSHRRRYSIAGETPQPKGSLSLLPKRKVLYIISYCVTYSLIF